MAHVPHHKAAPQHATTHDDPMALDIHRLLELELQHTDDTEQHRDQTPPGPESVANDPADPNGADSPQSAPPRPPPRERLPSTHSLNTLWRHHPSYEASKAPAEYRASLECNLPNITEQGLHRYTTSPPPGTST